MDHIFNRLFDFISNLIIGVFDKEDTCHLRSGTFFFKVNATSTTDMAGDLFDNPSFNPIIIVMVNRYRDAPAVYLSSDAFFKKMRDMMHLSRTVTQA